MMKPEDMSGEFISRLVDYISRSGEVSFEIAKTASSFEYVTLLRERGGYIKQPFIAGDKFTLVGAYLGKKNLVFIFHAFNGDAAKIVGPTSHEYKQAEFTESAAKLKLAGFSDWLDDFIAGEDVLSMASEKPREEPEHSEEELAEMRGDDWGSW